jgi:hypothetical protein
MNRRRNDVGIKNSENSDLVLYKNKLCKTMAVLTYLRSRALLEKPPIVQLLNNYGGKM